MEHVIRWATIQHNNDFAEWCAENGNNMIEILTMMYELNRKGERHIGIVQPEEDGGLSCTALKYIEGTDSDLDDKMSRVNFATQCPLVFAVIGKNTTYTLLRYPHTLIVAELSDSVDAFYYETRAYAPTVDTLKGLDKDLIHNILLGRANVIENLCCGELRDKLMRILIKSRNEEGIVLITLPSKFVDEKHTRLQFITKAMAQHLASETGYSEHLKQFESYNPTLDVIVMFNVSISSSESYYLPLCIPYFRFLADIQFRKKYLDYTFFVDEKNNKLFNTISKTTLGYVMCHSVHSMFGPSWNTGTLNLWQQRERISPKVIANIKSKINGYKTQDSVKFGTKTELTVDQVIQTFICYNYKCDECGKEVMIDHDTNCYLQYSLDRIKDDKPHTYDNIRLTCLSCNVNHQQNMYYKSSTTFPIKELIRSNCKKCVSHIQRDIYASLNIITHE